MTLSVALLEGSVLANAMQTQAKLEPGRQQLLNPRFYVLILHSQYTVHSTSLLYPRLFVSSLGIEECDNIMYNMCVYVCVCVCVCMCVCVCVRVSVRV